MANEYKIYKRSSPSDDWEFVDSVAAGTYEYVLPQMDNTVMSYAVSAVSAAGVESDKTIVRVEKSGELVFSNRPNRVWDAKAYAKTGGKVHVQISYSQRSDAAVQASKIQIARLIGETVNWASPLAEITLGSGLCQRTVEITGTYQNYETLSLQARAVTADDPAVPGPVFRLPPVAADPTPPPPVRFIYSEDVT